MFLASAFLPVVLVFLAVFFELALVESFFFFVEEFFPVLLSFPVAFVLVVSVAAFESELSFCVPLSVASDSLSSVELFVSIS